MTDNVARLTLWGVEVFVAVADEGSVSAAAKRLGASPSAISQQISSLETLLDTELLNRKTRPMSLTPAGRVLLSRATTILQEAALARSEISALDLSQLGQLRLGVVEDFESAVTPQLIGGMADHLTTTRFELETGPSHRLLDRLEHRALDVVVAAEIGEASDWEARKPLLRDPFVAVLPKGMRTVPADLPLIEYTRRHAMGGALAKHLSEQGIALHRRFELDSYRAMIAMVAGGAGWTILTALGAQYAGRFVDQVEVIELPFAPLERRISLYVRKDGVTEMADDIAQRMRPLIEDHVVTPALNRWPFLKGQLVML